MIFFIFNGIILIMQKRNSDTDSKNKIKNRTIISNVAHWLITQYKIYIKKDKPQ